MRRSKLFGGGLRVDALVAGREGVERVRHALVSTATPRTVISTDLASRTADGPGPKKCTSVSVFGKVCGVSARVTVAMKNCRAIRVRAVAAPLPKGTELIIGRDVIGRVVRKIDFSTTPAAITCRRTRAR